jgi:hypothetical protein
VRKQQFREWAQPSKTFLKKLTTEKERKGEEGSQSKQQAITNPRELDKGRKKVRVGRRIVPKELPP